MGRVLVLVEKNRVELGVSLWVVVEGSVARVVVWWCCGWRSVVGGAMWLR